MLWIFYERKSVNRYINFGNKYLQLFSWKTFQWHRVTKRKAKQVDPLIYMIIDDFQAWWSGKASWSINKQAYQLLQSIFQKWFSNSYMLTKQRWTKNFLSWTWRVQWHNVLFYHVYEFAITRFSISTWKLHV